PPPDPSCLLPWRNRWTNRSDLRKPAMLALVSLCAWIYLFFAHGAFWRSRPQLLAATPESFPDVDIIVPARDEAETIQAAIGSRLGRGYGGGLSLIFVDA